MLDSRIYDEDADSICAAPLIFEDDSNGEECKSPEGTLLRNEKDRKRRATEVYSEYSSQYKKSFAWLDSGIFVQSLANELKSDAQSLLKVLQKCGNWIPGQDNKLEALLSPELAETWSKEMNYLV